jgi:hypothetical protein
MNNHVKIWANRLSLMLVAVLTQVALYAQDKGLDVNVDIDRGGGAWYANPWIIAVGVAVFILLLVALMRGNNRTTA